MTAVVGILNKRGVAIAADSAVTRTRSSKEKVTKNGNKMVRVSNAVPISVMVTGNGCFMGNPWDVVVRCYRRERGHIPHPTVDINFNQFLYHRLGRLLTNAFADEIKPLRRLFYKLLQFPFRYPKILLLFLLPKDFFQRLCRFRLL